MGREDSNTVPDRARRLHSGRVRAPIWLMFYRLGLACYAPVIFLRLWWRGRREPAYRQQWAERLGRVPEQLGTGAIWCHAISAGETITAAPVIQGLMQALPEARFLVTAATPSGRERARRLLGQDLSPADRMRVDQCLMPYDFGFAVARFLDRLQPRALILTETELWPNLLHACAQRQIPVALLNGRLSARSARRYGWARGLAGAMLTRLDLILCQFDNHARRFVALGADPERVAVLGSVKFDLPTPDRSAVAAQRRRWGLAGRPVWIAGSTHPGEEAVALEAHRQVRARYANAVLILVPRHPVRAVDIDALVPADQLVRTSELGTGVACPAVAQVVLGDQMGELGVLYGLADAVFVGGSIADVGGHNLMEPAVFGLPIAMGPSDRNFPDVAAAFAAAGALVRTPDAVSLAGFVIDCWERPAMAHTMGEAALEVVRAHQGATARSLTALTEWLQKRR